MKQISIQINLLCFVHLTFSIKRYNYYPKTNFLLRLEVTLNDKDTTNNLPRHTVYNYLYNMITFQFLELKFLKHS